MSQAGIVNTAGGPSPPAVPTSFVTDVNSPSIPIANVENVKGGNTTANNILGIRTDGSSGSNTLTVQLTNRITGSATTADAATPATLFTFSLGATPGLYLFTGNVMGYDTTDALGTANTFFLAVRTAAGIATLIQDVDTISREDATMQTCLITYQFLANNFSIIVNGLAGKNIDWQTITTYEFVS